MELGILGVRVIKPGILWYLDLDLINGHRGTRDGWRTAHHVCAPPVLVRDVLAAMPGKQCGVCKKNWGICFNPGRGKHKTKHQLAQDWPDGCPTRKQYDAGWKPGDPITAALADIGRAPAARAGSPERRMQKAEFNLDLP